MTPSRWSVVENNSTNRSRSPSRPLAITVSRPVCTRRLQNATEIGLCFAACSASAMARSSASPLPTTSSTRPMRSAVAALTRSPHRIMRLAQPSPTSHDRRWVPPAQGSRPTPASGKAIWACSSAMRISQAMATSSPPPMAKPLTAAMETPRKSASASNASPKYSAIARAVAGSPSAKSFRSAPAEKNFSPAPVMTSA